MKTSLALGLTSGTLTKPNICGRIEWLVSFTVYTTDSFMPQYPKSTSSTSNSRSDDVTMALTVNWTGRVWSATRITSGVSRTPVSGSKRPHESSARVCLRQQVFRNIFYSKPTTSFSFSSKLNQARSHGGKWGQCPRNLFGAPQILVVPRNIFFSTHNKNKNISPLKMNFAPPSI